MASATDYQRLRSDIDASEAALSDVEAALIFAEAGESYTDAATIKAETRVIALQRFLASSAKLTTYRQNASSENVSDVFKHLKDLLKLWEERRDKAVASASLAAGSGARFGRTTRKPARVRELPGWE